LRRFSESARHNNAKTKKKMAEKRQSIKNAAQALARIRSAAKLRMKQTHPRLRENKNSCNGPMHDGMQEKKPHFTKT
jgi:hypothetical protein